MGHPGSVSRLVWHVKRDRKLEKSVNELEDLSQRADPTDLRLFLDCAGHVGAVHPNDPFHLLETPEPNLVAGMKWVLGGRTFQLSQSALGGKADAVYLEARAKKPEPR
jgi:hypothetical protein